MDKVAIGTTEKGIYQLLNLGSDIAHRRDPYLSKDEMGKLKRDDKEFIRSVMLRLKINSFSYNDIKIYEVHKAYRWAIETKRTENDITEVLTVWNLSEKELEEAELEKNIKPIALSKEEAYKF